MGKFESRDPRYVAGETCTYKWSHSDGPISPKPSLLKKCGKSATVGVPVRIGNLGEVEPCAMPGAQGDLFFCEEHWVLSKPGFAPGHTMQALPVTNPGEGS